jgi:uncharacterized protein HemX
MNNLLPIALIALVAAAGVTSVYMMKTQKDDLRALTAQMEQQRDAVKGLRLEAEIEELDRRAEKEGPCRDGSLGCAIWHLRHDRQ